MQVEVVYANTDKQLILSVDVPGSCTVQKAIELSGILDEFPEIDLSQQQVGIFSQKVNLAHQLREHDRVEIYRDLTIDPMDARRAKASQ